MPFFFSCKATKYLSNDENLLTSNKIIIQGDATKTEKNSLKSELDKLNNQKPNKKFLFVFRLRLGLYTAGNRPQKADKDTKFKTWMRDKIGEPPVILDSTLIDPTKNRMKNYMFNKGYFHNNVSATYVTKKKKATITYIIEPNDQFIIKEYQLYSLDTALDFIKTKEIDKSYIKPGDPYDSDNIKKERTRISDLAREQGYFTFNREYVSFQVDTTIGNNKVNIDLLVNFMEDSTVHKKYYIGMVQFSLDKKATAKDDLSKIDTFDIRKLQILLTSKDIKPDILARYIYFNTDSTFKESDYEKTVSRLNSLGVFKFVDVDYEPFQISIDEGIVDVTIRASMAKKQGATLELEGNTDNRSSLGLGLNLAFINRNIFKKADRLQFNLSSGLELNFRNINSNNTNQQTSLLNTLDLTSDVKIYFPKILFPGKKINKTYTPYEFKPTTFVGATYNFERRLNFYSIHTANVSYGYDFKTSDESRHIITFPLSLVRPVEKSFSAAFLENLQKSPFLRQSFEQQFIASLVDYTYFYTSQNFGKLRNFLYFKGNINLSGNILFAGNKLFTPKKETPYEIIKIPYSQFARIEGDFRYYFNFNKKQTLVTRVFAGIGVPYGNAEVLPYVKQFFGGGSQSLRAWRYKTIGPGGFDTKNADFILDQTGNMKLEANVEYRFDIYKVLKGAIFADMGNIWSLKADTSRPLGNFDIKRFTKEIGVGIGLGLRIDFNYFIIRFDAAAPIRDPSYPDDDRWMFNKYNNFRNFWRNYLTRNLGIGYPF